MTDIVQMISGCDGKRFGAAYVECIFIFIVSGSSEPY